MYPSFRVGPERLPEQFSRPRRAVQIECFRQCGTERDAVTASPRSNRPISCGASTGARQCAALAGSASPDTPSELRVVGERPESSKSVSSTELSLEQCRCACPRRFISARIKNRRGHDLVRPISTSRVSTTPSPTPPSPTPPSPALPGGSARPASLRAPPCRTISLVQPTEAPHPHTLSDPPLTPSPGH